MGKKNNSFRASYKLKVISFAEQFGNRAAEREFGILESSVRYWRKQKEALRNTKSDSRAFRGPEAGKYPALEDELVTYFEELRNDGDLHKKKYPHILGTPVFQRPKWKKSAQITQANTVIS